MAASNIALLTVGLTSTAALAQYQPVTAAGAPATAASNAVGFAQVAAGGSGERVPVVVAGTSIAIAGGTVNAGDPVKVHSTVTQVVAQGGTGTIIGRALTGGGSGEQIEVLIVGN